MNGGKKPANTGSGSPVLQGGEDVTAEYLVDGGLLLELCNEQSWPLPLGSVLGTVRVDDALPIVRYWGDRPGDDAIKVYPDGSLRMSHPDSADAWLRDIADQLPLGDFTEGRWGWLLSDPQPLREWWCEADAIGYPKLTDEVAQAPSVRAGLATSPRPRIGGWSIRASRVSSQRHPRVR